MGWLSVVSGGLLDDGGDGGTSSSSSEQTTNTTNYDNRVVSDNRNYASMDSSQTSMSDSRNYATSMVDSRSTSTVTNNTSIDAGAVAMAQKLGISAIDSNAKGFELLVGAVRDLGSAATATAKSGVEAVKDAYANQAQDASGQKNVMYAALVVIAIAVFAGKGFKA